MSRITNLFQLVLFMAFLLLVSSHERFLFNSYSSSYFVVAGTEHSPKGSGLSNSLQTNSPILLVFEPAPVALFSDAPENEKKKNF